MSLQRTANCSTRLPLRVALLDSVALQRVSIRRLLVSRGFECTAFDRIADLMVATCDGRSFDAMVLAFDAGTATMLTALREAAGAQSSILLVLNSSQLSEVSVLLQRIPPDGGGIDFIMSPIDGCELEFRLMALIFQLRSVSKAAH